MLGWDGDGAGRGGVEGDPCDISHLCMSSTSLILFRFHLTEAISEQLWVCGFQRRLRRFSGILYNFPVGKSQYWRSRAKTASGFLQNKIKWGVCRAESGASRGYFSSVGALESHWSIPAYSSSILPGISALGMEEAARPWGDGAGMDFPPGNDGEALEHRPALG